MMLSKVKSGGSLIASKDPSLKQLKALSKLLDRQHKQNTRVVKEINNETENGRKQQDKIDKSFQKISDEGMVLMRKHEQEKNRYEKLQALVKQLEDQQYQVKVDRMEELKVKGEVDKLEELKTQLAGKEKELQKIIEKTNTSTYESAKKVDSIRALRSERTIVSALMDNIQRQLCNLQHCYKVLVIERDLSEQQYCISLDQFKECEATAQQQIEKVIKNRQVNVAVQRQPLIKISEASNKQQMKLYLRCNQLLGSSRTSLLRAQNTDRRESRRERTARTFRELKAEEYDREYKSIMREKKVKQVFYDMGISNCEELPKSLESQLQTNKRLFETNTRMEEQIKSLNSELEILRLTKKVKRQVSPLNTLCSKKRGQLEQFNTDLKNTRAQLNEFNLILKAIYDDHVSSSPSELDGMQAFFNQEQETNFYMTSMQTFLQHSLKPVIHRAQESKAEMKEEGREGKLAELLSNSRQHKNSLAIYDQQDLVNFARKNLRAVQAPTAYFHSEGC